MDKFFDIYDYNEHADYCEYIFNSNDRLGLNLNDKKEIQKVANMYYDKLEELEIVLTDELYEDDDLLVTTVEEFRKMPKLGSHPDDIPAENISSYNASSSKFTESVQTILHDELYDDHGLDEGLTDIQQENSSENDLDGNGLHL